VRQVADFQAHLDEFRNENIDVIALSVDPAEKAKEMVERTGATFPIAYGLKVPEDAAKVGAYWEERRGIFHATDFTLDSSHRILQACFATGPIGRMTAADVLSSIRGTKKRKAQAG
jgi:peroxiredoxin